MPYNFHKIEFYISLMIPLSFICMHGKCSRERHKFYVVESTPKEIRVRRDIYFAEKLTREMLNAIFKFSVDKI